MQQQVICTIFRPIKAHHLLLGEFLETVVSLGLRDLVDLASSPPVSQSSILGSPNQGCHPSSAGTFEQNLDALPPDTNNFCKNNSFTCHNHDLFSFPNLQF